VSEVYSFTIVPAPETVFEPSFPGCAKSKPESGNPITQNKKRSNKVLKAPVSFVAMLYRRRISKWLPA
jgi:hypothetical protein